jgi:hypothetical protein
MLVYSSMLHLMDRDPRPAVRVALRAWLDEKLACKLTDEQLRQGKHQITPTDLLEVEEVEFLEQDPPAHRRAEHDWATAFRYSHADKQVHGRRWITEIGLSVWSGTLSYATVRLQTEEQSALALAPIATTRPKVTELILNSCKLHRKTPGGNPREVREDDVGAFTSLVRDRDRRHPILLVRRGSDGFFSVSPARVAELCVGIAEVAVVSLDQSDWEFPATLGNLLPEPGSVHILWPVAEGKWAEGVAKTRILAEHVEEALRRGDDPSGIVLARVCHETNAKVSGWHIDTAAVRTLRLQFDLRLARERIEKSATPEQVELLAMYEKFEKDDKAKIAELERKVERANDIAVAERAARGEAEEEAKQARLKAETLEHAFQDSKRAPNGATPDRLRLREALHKILHSEPSLEDSLVVVDHLFADRVLLLDSAWKSARDASQFRGGSKAFDLLWKLCIGYHDAMSAGGGDKQAIQVFGNTSFAARESETVENNKRARSLRTFTYKGDSVEMMRHLKIGVKPSDATTFRCHFHWDPQDQVVVIGHCGCHLDHD